MRHSRLRPGRRVLIAGLVVLGGIQFIPVERSNPPVRTDVSAPGRVENILRRACYDCHSNETRWPWYSRIAPTSWLVASHVKRGRGDLNFSEWPVFDFELQGLAYDDIRKQVSEERMPLWSYTLVHRNARLSAADREVLLQWVGK